MRRTRSCSALNDAAGISGPGSSHLNPRLHTPHTLTGVTAARRRPPEEAGGGRRGARGGRQTALSAPSSTRRGSRVLQMPSAAMAGMLMGAQVTHGTSTSTADSPDPSSGLLSSQEDANHRLPPSAAADGAPLKMLPVPLQNSISDIAEAFNLEDFNRRRSLTWRASAAVPQVRQRRARLWARRGRCGGSGTSPASPSRRAQHASFVPSPRMTRRAARALDAGDEPSAALPGGASTGGGGGAGMARAAAAACRTSRPSGPCHCSHRSVSWLKVSRLEAQDRPLCGPFEQPCPPRRQPSAPLARAACSAT